MAPATRFLVTGAQGFLGRHLVHAILTRDSTAMVVGIGRSSFADDFFTHLISLAGRSFRAPVPAYLRIASDRYQYRTLDLVDGAATQEFVQQVQPDVVIHTASGLRGDPIDRLLRNGVESVVRLMEALGSLSRRPRFLLCSSGGVYGSVPEDRLPITEDAPTCPVELYGVSKLAAEHACRVLAQQHEIPAIYARLFNLVGPGQDERHVCGRFVAHAVAIAAGLEACEMFTANLGSTRDFIDVRDCARAVLLLANRGLPGEIYNVASGEETMIASVLDIVLKQAGLKEKVRIITRAGEPGIKRHYGSIDRLTRLGFRTEQTLQESLRDLRDYYRERLTCRAG